MTISRAIEFDDPITAGNVLITKINKTKYAMDPGIHFLIRTNT